MNVDTVTCVHVSNKVCECRAAKTLLYYFFEMNPTLYGWFMQYLKEHKIPKEGSWDDISGETFLRELLTTPIEETNWGKQVVRLDKCCFISSSYVLACFENTYIQGDYVFEYNGYVCVGC